MGKSVRKYITALLLLALLAGLTGCGQKPPDGITVSLDGEKIATLDIMTGYEQSGIRAEITPSDYAGEITWCSEDSGIAKIVSSSGAECTLSARKIGSTKLTVECGGVSVSVRVHVLEDPSLIPEVEPALTVRGVTYSAEQLGLYYAEQYYAFLDQNGAYASYYGLDTSGGIQSLAEQACDSSSDGTWRGYFLEAAAANLAHMQALCDYAKENGICLTEEDEANMSAQIDALEDTAAQFGYTSLAAFLKDYYGEGITPDLYEEAFRTNTLAEKAYKSYVEGLQFTDEEIAAHYLEMGYAEGENEFPVTAMRHILIMAEADENGAYSAAAIAEAHRKAETIYAEWANGAPTEEHFAELANRYSDDSGSNTNGGIYTNIYQGQMVEGIDSWLYGQKRNVGDTAIIDNDGSYTGTHIVYFLGYGERYSTILGRNGLVDDAYAQWMEELSSAYPYEPGTAYDKVGIF